MSNKLIPLEIRKLVNVGFIGKKTESIICDGFSQETPSLIKDKSKSIIISY